MSVYPAVSAGSLVLVTGVNGFVASHIAHKLLARGYRVRGTVRVLKSASHVQKSFAKYTGHFEVVEVPVISDKGAFDSALKGTNAVIHTACPISMEGARPEETYVPAVDGTLSLLKSAAQVPSIKRVVHLGSTSSCVLGDKDPEKEVLDASDWNTESDPAVWGDPNNTHLAFHIYCGAKTVSEKAAFDWVAKEKPGFSFNSVLCSLIFGSIHRELSIAPPSNMSVAQIYDVIADPPRLDGVSPVVSIIWVSAEDVTDLFVASLTSDKTPGRRLIAHAGLVSAAQIADIVRKEFPDRLFPPVRQDAPTLNFRGAEHVKFNTELEEELLGGGWRPLDETVLTVARELITLEKEWHRLGEA